MAQLLQPKQQLAGYEIGELVGKGGMGEVYRARQISMDRVVALKILAPRLVKQDPIFAKRFVDEARAAGRLNHPNIIAVHDVGKAPMPGSSTGIEPDLDYFSMEFVDGESVKEVIDRQSVCPLSLVAQVMQGMTEAMVYAEAQGIVHRDIKPDNIMITNSGVVKLADLGLALQLGGEEIVDEKDGQGRSKVMGTPLYMSPEQARALPVDSRSDQYSLGATLFHMLTGKPPFKGDNAKAIMRSHVFDPVPDPKDVNVDVQEGWRQLTMRLLAKAPEDRFPTGVAMRAAVQAAISGHGNPGISRRVRTTGPTNSTQRAAQMPGWARNLVYAFGGAVVLMVLAFTIDWGPRKDPKPPENTNPAQNDPEQKQLERVKAAISVLPADHEKAIADIDKLAEDKTILAGPVRDLINRERAARQTAWNEQKRKQKADKDRERKERFNELERALVARDLNKVKECITYLNAESEKLSSLMRDQLATIKAQFNTALVDLQVIFINELGNADTAEELKALTVKVSASALSEETQKEIKQQIIDRTKELALVNPTIPTIPTQPINDVPQWRALNTQLDELRGGFNYGKITQLADKESAAFLNPESKAHVQSIAALARLASKAEGALRVYVEFATPMAELDFNNRRTRAKLKSIDDKKVGCILQDGARELDIKLDRGTIIGSSLRQLMEKALEDGQVPVAERPAMIAAILWAWRYPDAAEVFATIPNHPMTLAVLELERKTRVLDLQARVVRAANNSVTVTYDGAKGNPWFIGDFIGHDAQIVAQGLAWTVKTTVKLTSPETEIPTLRWKQSLRPPFTLIANVMLQPKTYLLMLGVTSGDRTIRIGLNNTRDEPLACAVQSMVDGPGLETLKHINTEGKLVPLFFRGLVKTGGPQRLDVRVDADYNVHLRLNDTKLGVLLKLPPGGPITPVIQSVHLDGQEVMTTIINSLVLSGTLPSAE